MICTSGLLKHIIFSPRPLKIFSEVYVFSFQLSIEAHTGTPPAADWKRPPGRPRRNWLQQVEEDVGLSVGAAWIAG